MKNIFKYAAMLFVAVSAAACSGTSDEPTPGNENPGNETQSGFTLAADKTTIESDGKDCATFKILDENGNDVTSNYRNIVYTNITTGSNLAYGTKSFSSYKDGAYEFKAQVIDGQNTYYTENTLEITSQNRSNYEKYKQKVGIYKMTATWCQYCPSMTTALHNVREDLQDNMIIMALHNGDAFAVNMGGGYDLVSYVASAMGANSVGLPTNAYKVHEMSGDRSTSYIEKTLESYFINYPASSGVKITSAKREGDEIVISGAAIASKAGTYDLGCMILADNLYDGSSYAENGIHNDVVVATTANMNGVMSDKSVTLDVDEEIEGTFTFPALSIDDTDLRAVIFTIKKLEDGTTIMDNANVCALNSSVNYELND